MQELEAVKIILNNHGKPMASIQGTTCYYGISPYEMFYRKSEADKVIDELKDKVQMHDFFWEGCGFAKRGFKNAIAVSQAFDDLALSERHQKYKRCFRIAKWCINMMIFNSKYGTDRKWHFFKNWRDRWLALAHKFKEG